MSAKKSQAHQRRHDAYKNSGRRSDNKIKKQTRHKKRLERFAKRKEEGKCYEYDKARTNQKLQDYRNGKIEEPRNFDPEKWNARKKKYGAYVSNKGCKKSQTYWGKRDSAFRKLENEAARAILEKKNRDKNKRK